MRQVKEYVAKDGTKTFRVRYRSGGRQHSETFRRKTDAQTFAAILDGGGVPAAVAWLDSRAGAREAPTFAEHFTRYVDNLTGVTSRTRDDYRALSRRYLTELDAIPVNLLGRGHITALVNRLDDSGLSAKTIKNVIHMLSSALAAAVEEGHLTRNPCRGVRLPQRGLGGDDPRFLEPHEFTVLLAHIPEHYRPLVMFLVGTGCRWSEATALQGRHVSIQRGTVRIDQAWKRAPGKGWELGPPKSEKGRRTINAAVLALAAAEPLLRGPSAFVFTTPTGRPVRHNNFHGRVWQPACVAAGLDPAPRIHDLRHTHASWLLSDGISLEAVQDQLGHESILTTRKVYGHLQPAIGAAVGKAASEALARAMGRLPDGPRPIAGAGLGDLDAATGADAVHGADQLGEPAEELPDVERDSDR